MYITIGKLSKNLPGIGLSTPGDLSFKLVLGGATGLCGWSAFETSTAPFAPSEPIPLGVSLTTKDGFFSGGGLQAIFCFNGLRRSMIEN